MEPLHPDRVLFTFPDGVVSYECRGCAACCKGLGIGFDAVSGEIERLVERYPPLVSFIRRRGRTWTAFNPRGRCWFLDTDGWCAIEVAHGRELKPASCRLFPFNRIFRVGSWGVVDFNSVICPLRALPLSETSEDAVGLSGRVRHQDVLADIAQVEDPAVVGTPLPAARPEVEGRALVERERRVAEVCFQAAHRCEGEEPVGAGVLSEVLSEVLSAQAGSELAASRARQAVGAAVEWMLDEPLERPGVESLRVALLLTPSMRFNELYGPRQYAERDPMLSVLPGIWLAWLHFLARGEAMAGRALTIQEATSVWGEQVVLGYLMARFLETPSLDPGRQQLPAEAEPRQTATSFGQRCVANRRRQQPLSQLLEPVVEGAGTVAERVARLRWLEPVLASLRFSARRKGSRKRHRRGR